MPAEWLAVECRACRECMMVVGCHANVGSAAAAGTAMQRGGRGEPERASRASAGGWVWVGAGWWCRAVRAGGSPMQMEHLQCSSMLSSSRDTLSLQPGRQAGAQAAVAGGSEAAVVTPLAA